MAMRLRETDERTGSDNEIIYHMNYPPYSIASYLQPPPKTGTYKAVLDTPVPGFRERSKRGEVFFNYAEFHRLSANHSFSSHTFTQGTGTVSMQRCPYAWMALGSPQYPCDGFPPSGLNYHNLKTEAGTEAMANVESPVFAAASFAAELGETVQLLANPIRSLTRHLQNLQRQRNRRRRNSQRRTHFGGPSDQSNGQMLRDFVSDNWLTYQLGFKPIVGDMVNAMIAIDKTVTDHRPRRQTARGGTSATASGSHHGGIHWSSRRFEETFTADYNTYVTAGILYEVSRSPDTFGLGMENIPMAAYEGLPGSFVLDYFANVGPFLQAMTPKAGVRYLGSWTTVRESISVERVCEMTEQYLAAPNTFSGSGRFTATAQVENSVRTAGVTVGITRREASFQGVPGVTRILNMLALVNSLLSSR